MKRKNILPESNPIEEAAQRLLKECSHQLPPAGKLIKFMYGHIQDEDISVSSPAFNISEVSDPCLHRILESATRPPDVNASDPQPIEEWTDKQPGPMKTIHLTHLPLNNLLNLARNTFQNLLHGNISQKTIGSLLLLAYNIMDEEGDFLTSEPCSDLIDITSRITVQDLSGDSTNSKRGPGKTLIEFEEILDEDEKKRLCIAYTYLAASYMRLFAKSAEHYLKIKNRLRTMFPKFYSFKYHLENFHHDLKTTNFIRQQLQRQEIYRNTFYVFLYASCENTKGNDLKDFLYRDHVSYIGLHPVSLFLQVMKSYNTGCEPLVKIMYSEGFLVELHGIIEVFGKLVKRKAGNKLQMWRFARVVDDGFLSVLRTKNCVLFTLMLAYFLKMLDPVRNTGYLEISQIKNASESDKVVANAYASRVSEMHFNYVIIPFMNHVADAPFSDLDD